METDFEQLGKDFQDNLKAFILKSDELKKNQLHRVTKALAAYPLEDDLITLIHLEEKVVYELGVQLQSLKLNMMVESLKQDAEDERITTAKENRIPSNIEKPDYANQGE